MQRKQQLGTRTFYVTCDVDDKCHWIESGKNIHKKATCTSERNYICTLLWLGAVIKKEKQKLKKVQMHKDSTLKIKNVEAQATLSTQLCTPWLEFQP